MTATAPAPTIEYRQVPPLPSFNNVTVEADIRSYRQISNLSLVSEIVERLVVNRMNVHANHSTETAVTIVYNYIVHSSDAGFCLPWCCWISVQHSTPLITAYCWRYSPNDMVSRTLNLIGSVDITLEACIHSQLQAAARLRSRLPVAFLTDQ